MSSMIYIFHLLINRIFPGKNRNPKYWMDRQNYCPSKTVDQFDDICHVFPARFYNLYWMWDFYKVVCFLFLSFYSLSLIVKCLLFLSLIPHFLVQETKLSQRTALPAAKSPKLPPVKSSSSSWAFLDYAGAVIFGIVVLVAIVLGLCCFFKCVKLAGPVAPV